MTTSLLTALKGIEESPWKGSEADGEHPLTARRLVNLLRPYVRPGNIRLGNSVAKGYLRESFEDAFTRYWPHPAATPLQVNETARLGKNLSATPPDVAGRNPAKPPDLQGCSAVAERAGGTGRSAKGIGP